MTTSETQPQQDGKASKTQNARRYGMLGLLAGAVLGLTSGGGIFAVFKMAMVVCGASALGGMVVGNKLNPLVNKFMDKLPGRKKQENGQGNAPQQAQGHAPVVQQQMEPTQQQGAVAAPPLVPQRSLMELGEEALNGIRTDTRATTEKAHKGMDPEAPPLTPASAPRQPMPTHDVNASRAVH